jgi:hypothetical protein
METNEPIDADEASAALAAVRHSRARVAWGGYPAWYWIGTGACLGALTYASLLPGWWSLVISAVIAVLLVTVARAASRARGVCEGWTGNAMKGRDVVVLYGPPALVMLAGGAASKYASWSSIVAAVLLFVLFAGTGLALSARTARTARAGRTAGW